MTNDKWDDKQNKERRSPHASERPFLREAEAGQGYAIGGFCYLHFHHRRVGRGDLGGTEHGVLREHFAVNLGDKMILAGCILAPDLSELNILYGHNDFLGRLRCPAPKGAPAFRRLTASLKRCPDTKLQIASAACLFSEYSPGRHAVNCSRVTLVEARRPHASGFVTMNHSSGGTECLAEMCRVSPAAADDRKVSGKAKVRFKRRSPIVFLPSMVCRSVPELVCQRPSSQRRLRPGKQQPHPDMILGRQSVCVRSSRVWTLYIPG